MRNYITNTGDYAIWIIMTSHLYLRDIKQKGLNNADKIYLKEGKPLIKLLLKKLIQSRLIGEGKF